jgi:high-affinity iron transporter
VLATLVIGLREGLEAALIVGIIAAFLKRNGRSLVPMWIGVAAALVASVAVGVALSLIEQSLPQAAQEGMETIIGLVAVFFVTSMIVWMQHHARGMKRELEAEAGEALREGTAWALAGMAFLAVLKEGFETSVFLLATFQASTNSGLAALGAVIGVLIAAGIGVGIYQGGIRLDLGRFFRYTGVFLLLVAAGLVLSLLRTAHEAGWIVAGQQRTLDLSWLAPNGSVQAALLTGVLGIPGDPRLIEVVGWFAYLVPMGLFMFWPQRTRPDARAVPRIQLGVAIALLGIAIGAAVFAPIALHPVNRPLALAQGGEVRLAGDRIVETAGDRAVQDFALRPGDGSTRGGVTSWNLRTTGPAEGPTTLTRAELTEQNGGRVPVGIDARRAPGPYRAAWTATTVRTVRTADGVLLDAEQQQTRIVTVSGGGLSTPRTLSVAGGVEWHAAPDAVAAAASSRLSAMAEQRLWGVQLPAALVVAALITAAFALRSRFRSRREGAPASDMTAASTPSAPQAPSPAPTPSTAQKRTIHATH